MGRKEHGVGVVKVDYFHKSFLSPSLFRYKLGAILDFRNSVHHS
jgi:hypothetical protein